MRRHLSEFAVVDDLPNIMLSVAAAAAAEKLNSQLKNIDYSAQLPSGRSLLCTICISVKRSSQSMPLEFIRWKDEII